LQGISDVHNNIETVLFFSIKKIKMKTIFSLLILAVSIIAIPSSCKKTKAIDSPLTPQLPPVTLDSMLRCRLQISQDSAAIHAALIGKWQWEFIKCYWTPEKANGEDFKTLSVEFKQNDTVEVKENGLLTQKSSWSLIRLNDGYFKLSVTPIVYQLPGKVLFCENRLLFFDSYVDGCDNYFKKQN
jgi:hypothetical protein